MHSINDEESPRPPPPAPILAIPLPETFPRDPRFHLLQCPSLSFLRHVIIGQPINPHPEIAILTHIPSRVYQKPVQRLVTKAPQCGMGHDEVHTAVPRESPGLRWGIGRILFEVSFPIPAIERRSIDRYHLPHTLNPRAGSLIKAVCTRAT